MVKQIETVEEVLECIEINNSFVVTGGAGSGKTELLKDVLEKVKNISSNKKAICITHTNIAVDEIKERTNNIFEVSTIHSFCQNIISKYKINLKELLINIFKLPSVEEYSLEKGINTLSHDVYKKLAEKYWKKNLSINNEKSENIVGKKEFDKNPEKFIKDLDKNIEKLNLKIQEIIKEQCNYKEIKYNETKYDSIKKFTYGHDSLLLLFVSILEKYPILQKILRDKYDIIFIDEYQDSNKKIIEVLLKKFVDKNHIIGLFGDHMQSIYNDGIGNVQNYIDRNLIKNIPKKDNFRCSKEVIDLLNFIRKDLKQELALTKNQSESDRKGSVKIYYKTIDFSPKDDKVKYFELIDNCIDTINKNDDYKVLLLSNQALAKKLKYESLYNIFSNGINDAKEEIDEEMNKMQWLDAVKMYDYYITGRYNLLIEKLKHNDYIITNYEDKLNINTNFKKINKELKLADVMKLLFENSLLKKSDTRDRECKILKSYIEECNKNEEYVTFKENYLEYNTYTKMNKITKIDKEDFYLFETNMHKEQKYSKILSEEVKFEEILNYYDFINERKEYITMHKTKGSSIDNVIVVMENYFWNQYNFDKLINEDKNSLVYENTKKLFYVSCSRTRKNLSILKIINKNDVQTLKDYFKEFDIQELN